MVNKNDYGSGWRFIGRAKCVNARRNGETTPYSLHTTENFCRLLRRVTFPWYVRTKYGSFSHRARGINAFRTVDDPRTRALIRLDAATFLESSIFLFRSFGLFHHHPSKLFVLRIFFSAKKKKEKKNKKENILDLKVIPESPLFPSSIFRPDICLKPCDHFFESHYAW